ncbi:hypothetical protein [Brevibacillus borstelensis]|uniref:hypothetical protein n=1 Tax=Brevibacillus borstelensis TaxID=45462 RepID=UPI00203C9A85|nr:hypothetical protein [Brevibacillus borstelensis]MCM3470198.1 hypothetical protein [Brevibacillus borstelensis]
MVYSDKQIQDRESALRERFNNFKQVIFKKYSEGDLFFEALGFDGEEKYLRLKRDGKLFVHLNAQWIHVKNFIYRE